MHYQVLPATEVKIVRCTRGAVYDVIIDLRPGSPTYGSHIGVELSAENRRTLYVPEMFGHGYQTLTDDAEVMYQVSEMYTPGSERGLRYDDPTLGSRGRCLSVSSLRKTRRGRASTPLGRSRNVIMIDRALEARAAAGTHPGRDGGRRIHGSWYC